MARQAFADWTLATTLRRDSTPLTADFLGDFVVGVLGALGYLTAIRLMLLMCLALGFSSRSRY